MKQLCKDLYIQYNEDLTTSERKTDIIITNRGVVIKTLSKKDPIAIAYMRRVYKTNTEKILADFIESADDSYPEMIARTAFMLAHKAHPVDIAQYLNHYCNEDEKGDIEVSEFITHVQGLLNQTERLVKD